MLELKKSLFKKRIEYSFKKKNSFYTSDLAQGILIALIFHGFLILFFRIEAMYQEESYPLLSLLAVEVDRKSLEVKPLILTSKTDFPFSIEDTLTFPKRETFPLLQMRYEENSEMEVFSHEISYSSALSHLDLPTTYLPISHFQLFFPSEEEVYLTKKSKAMLSETCEKKEETCIVRLLFHVTLDLGSGKFLQLELNEIWQEHPKARVIAEEFLRKLEFEKGKEKKLEGSVELWLELEKVSEQL